MEVEWLGVLPGFHQQVDQGGDWQSVQWLGAVASEAPEGQVVSSGVDEAQLGRGPP